MKVEVVPMPPHRTAVEVLAEPPKLYAPNFLYVGPLTAETLHALRMSFEGRVVRIEATDAGPAPEAEGSAK